MSLRGIMECDLKTFYSSSASPLRLCSLSLSVSSYLPSVFSSPPTIFPWLEGGLSTLWLVLLAVVQLWRMPAWLWMSCTIKMDQHKTPGEAALFSISLKRQHWMRIGTSSGVREIPVGLFVSFHPKTCSQASRFLKEQEPHKYCRPKWISVCIFTRKTPLHVAHIPPVSFSCVKRVSKCSQAISVTMNKQAFTALLKMAWCHLTGQRNSPS